MGGLGQLIGWGNEARKRPFGALATVWTEGQAGAFRSPDN